MLVKIADRFGLSWYNRYLLKMLKRPEWLYKAYKKIPLPALSFLPPLEVSGEDVALCERLIAANRKALAPSPSLLEGTSNIWSDIISHHHRELIEPLERGDAKLLAAQLSSMFQKAFMYGISSGNLYESSRSRVGAKIWPLKCLDDLVSLAEYLRVVRTECPEQGATAYAFKDGLDALVGETERALGVCIGFPNVGAPYGVRAGESLITMESPEHIYAALRILQNIKLHLSPERAARPKVVEIGAGFGGTAYWFLKLTGEVESYTIIDLPLVNVLQGYFLSKALGADRVLLYGEGSDGGAATDIVRVWPTHALNSVGGKADVLVNENSMPEMPEQAVTDYLTWARDNLDGIFYSYNQEAFSPVREVPQVLVPEAVRRVGGFRSLNRNHSWLRRGYVEEVYKIDAA